jgi:hypothetical protein
MTACAVKASTLSFSMNLLPCAKEAFTEVLRPALSDRLGGALFIGTPKGRNHFYELFQAARELPDWAAFQYTTEQGGIVALHELEDARSDLDERTYRSEYQASFESLGQGSAYYAFDRVENVQRLAYNRSYPLLWALDFNVNPLCSVLAQEWNGQVHILQELILPNSNTLAACEEFLHRTAKLPSNLNVYVYGDATGEQERTSASRTDWQIVKNFFGRYKDRFNASFRVPRSNPPVKDRINCVNAKLRNYAGHHSLLVDPACKQLIKDFEQVCWKADPNGNALAELDKSDPMRTHTSDAVGYLIAQDFPMRSTTFGEHGGPPII